MQQNKNGLLFSYIDSLENSNLYTKYKIKKIPSLNKYAENYLALLDKKNSNNYINNDSENYNEYKTSVKGISNDISNNETSIKTNQISKVNDNYTINRLDEVNEKGNPISIKIKTRNNLEIEYLKQNFNFNKEKAEEDITSKINENNAQQKTKFSLKTNIKKNNNGISALYKKISPPYKTKLNSPIFSAFKKSNSKHKCQIYKFSNNYDFLDNSNSKSVNSLNSKKKNKKTNNFFFKGNSDYILKPKIKTKLSFFSNKNILTNYIYSDRDKFRNNQRRPNRKNNNQLQNNFSESHTDESFVPFNSVSYRYNANKSVSQSMEDYWKEKELKKRIKLDKLRKEKIYKENCELRDRPEINKNSRKIAENIIYNSSINVFDRLSDLAKDNLYFKIQKSNMKPDVNNIYKIKLYKQINCQKYLHKNKKKGIQTDKKFKSFKQIENNNKDFCEKMDNKLDNNQLINLNKYINKKENQKYDEIDKNKIMLLNKVKKQWIESYDYDVKKMQKSKKTNNNNNNIIIKLTEPKIMYKTIEKNNFKKKNNKNGIYIDTKNIDGNIIKSIFINKRDNIFSEHNSKKNIFNNTLNKTINDNKSIKNSSVKNKPKNLLINKIKIMKNPKNIKDVQIFSNKKQKSKTIKNIHTNDNSNSKIKCIVEKNYNYKYDNNYTTYDALKNITIINNKIKNNNKKKNKISKSNNKNLKLVIETNNNYTINNSNNPNNNEYFDNYTEKNLINYYSTTNNNNNNNTFVSNVHYYKIPRKNELIIKGNDKINEYKTDYFKNNNVYDSNIENRNHINNFNFNKSIEIRKIEHNNKNRIIPVGLKKDKKICGLENYIDIPSSDRNIIEKTQKISRRRMELIKLLDFSSSIGTPCNTKY